MFSVAASASASDTAPRIPPHNMKSLYLASIGCAMRARLSTGISP